MKHTFTAVADYSRLTPQRGATLCFRTGAAMCENAAECVTVSVTSASGPDGSDATRLKRAGRAGISSVELSSDRQMEQKWPDSADFQLVPVVAIDRLRTIDATGFKTTDAEDDRLDRKFRRRLVRGHVGLKDRRIVFTD
jgi:hypothetical protein